MADRSFQEAETLRELITRSGLTASLNGAEAPTLREGRQHPASPETDQLGRYAVTGRLGAGGMGEVLQVRDEDVGREMAAKVVLGQADQRTLAKFIREGQITGQLEHPNIVPLYELGMTADRRIYFTMKQVRGDDLAALLRAEREAEGALLDREDGPRPSSHRLAADITAARRRSLARFLNIFTKVCDAMSFAHSRGVIHRDLKPANIMVGQFGEVQVMDWGLAKVVGEADAAEDRCTLDLGGGDVARMASGQLRTLDGAVAGTPAYMPPEQARGEIARLDRRADVYALGAILYEMLTLLPPFEGENAWNVLHQVLEGQMIRPSERTPERHIPWELEAVVVRAMSPRPKDRYDDVVRLKADIERYIEGGTLAAARYTPAQLLGKWVNQHRHACGAVAAVLLVTASTLGWMRFQRHQELQGHLGDGLAAFQAKDFDRSIAAYAKVLAAAPGHARAKAGMERAFLALAQRQVGTSPSAKALHARWRVRDQQLREGKPERPEEPAARDKRENVLQAYLSAVATLDRGLGRLPSSEKLRALREEAGEALGWSALLGRDYSLARQAFTQLVNAGLSADQAKELADHVRKDRDRRLDLWKKRVASIVDDIRKGLHRSGRRPGAAKFEDHVIEASAYRHPAIVEQLGIVLRQEIVGVAAQRGQKKTPWSQAERDLAVFICQVLGRIGLKESVDVLGEWMAVVVDDRLAAECGIALCNTRRGAAQSLLVSARRRLGTNSGFWRQAGPFFSRVPGAGGRHATPGRAQEFYKKGVLLAARRDYQGAIEQFSSAIGISPDYAAAYNNRGLARLRLDKLDDAIADFDRATQLDPNHVNALLNRGAALMQRGDLTRAEADFDRCLKLDPACAMAHCNRGAIRQARGDLEGAIADCTRALMLDDRLEQAYNNRGNARRLSGDLKGAIADYGHAIRIRPRSARFHGNRGLARLDAGDIAGAISDCDTAIRLNARYVNAYNTRGRARLARRDWTGALSDFDQAIEIDPRFAPAYCSRGATYAELGKPGRAIADFDSAIRYDPRSAEAYNGRGKARKRRGDPQGALADYTRAIRLDPRYASAHLNRGNLYFGLRRYRAASSDYQRALEIDPTFWQGWANRGICLVRLGKKAEAVVSLRKAKALAPSEFGPGLERRIRALEK